MSRLNNFLKKININPKTKILSDYTTYKIGGLSKLFFIPNNIKEAEHIFKIAIKEKINPFILGGGSNILVNDKKELNLVIIYTGNLNKIKILEKNKILAESGVLFEKLCNFASNNSFKGLEFIYGLPGTLGGAIWMNARCFEREISDIVESVKFVDEAGNINTKKIDKSEFDYKTSPFQNENCLILSAILKLQKGNKEKILKTMFKYKEERIKKGHYLFPSGGSIFKNNKKFLKPSGKIIEECGLKGISINNAKVAKYHGNFIINKKNAKADDIRELIKKIKLKVYEKTGFLLEEEILYIGFD